MSQAMVDEGALTLLWRQRGIEDTQVVEARTATMGATFLSLEHGVEQIVGRLPRLQQSGPTQTVPELQMKGTLGEGGMGLVELAEQLSLGRDVAVKRVREAARSEQSTMVLLREGWMTGLLEHPNIVPVYTLGRNDAGEPVIVMKKISGTSWLQIMENPSLAPQAFDAEDVLQLHLDVLSQVCNAVEYAHNQGLIHRDLKPENVMLGEFGEVYVLDWGIAVSLRPDPAGRLPLASQVDSPAGTPAYMAPEMAEGNGEDLGVHTDVFLLGAILHEILTGRPPYEGRTLFQLLLTAYECPAPLFDESVPRELAEICKKAMAREPEKRFESARALRDALVEYERGREARRLAEKGSLKKAEVTAVLLQEREGQAIDERALYKMFGECRFAYEQSLERLPQNEEALQGLQQMLELMADRELNRDAQKAASLLIADFPRPNPEYQTRLAKLEARLQEKERDYESLQKIRHDMDVEVGRGSRTFLALILGAFWGGLSFLLAFLIEKELFEFTHPRVFVHAIGLTAAMGLILFFLRHRIFDNQINRRLFLSILCVFACVTIYRGMGWILHLPLEQAFAIELLLYGMASVVMSVALDRRILIVSLTMTGAAVASAIWPAALFWLFALANVTAMGLLAWIWWPKDDENLCKIDSFETLA